MPALAYTAPTSVEDAVRALAGASGPAKVLSGGDRPAGSTAIRPSQTVADRRHQENPPASPASARRTASSSSARRHLAPRSARTKPLKRAWPGIVEAANLIGSTQVQGRASLAGNLCNASPAADSVPALIAARATCVIVGGKGKREVPVESICTGPGENVACARRIHHRVSAAEARAALGRRLPALHSAYRDGHRGRWRRRQRHARRRRRHH